MTRRVIGRGVATAGLGVLLLAAGAVWDEAEADRRRGRHHGFPGKHFHFPGKHFHGPRVFIGPRFHVGPRAYPYYSPYYYGHYGGYYGYAPPVVVTPPPVVVTPPPTSYIERAPAAQYWHYCQDPAGYYPDVQQCPGGWVQVPPRSD
jgi:hypothetical protein